MEQIVYSPWCEILQWTNNGHFYEAPIEDVKTYGKAVFEQDWDDARFLTERDGQPHITLAGIAESRHYNDWWMRQQEIL